MSACARDKQGQRRVGPTSARTTIRVHRTPPFVRGARERLHTRHRAEALSVAQGRGVTVTRAGGKVTSLVRALALHGVAMLRSHLASPLRPGRGVLIRSVSRRLGSVACVREDASPNEVSVLTNQSMPVPIPECQTGQGLPPAAHRSVGPLCPGEENRRMISCHQASKCLAIVPCLLTCPITEEPQCPPHPAPPRSPT